MEFWDHDHHSKYAAESLAGFGNAQPQQQKLEQATNIADKTVALLSYMFLAAVVPGTYAAYISWNEQHYLVFALIAGSLSFLLALIVAALVLFKLEERGWWADFHNSLSSAPSFDWDSFTEQFWEYVHAKDEEERW